MDKTFTIDKEQKPTKEQLAEVEEAKKHPIVFDDDCRELSPGMMKALEKAVALRNGRRKA